MWYSRYITAQCHFCCTPTSVAVGLTRYSLRKIRPNHPSGNVAAVFINVTVPFQHYCRTSDIISVVSHVTNSKDQEILALYTSGRPVTIPFIVRDAFESTWTFSSIVLDGNYLVDSRGRRIPWVAKSTIRDNTVIDCKMNPLIDYRNSGSSP